MPIDHTFSVFGWGVALVLTAVIVVILREYQHKSAECRKLSSEAKVMAETQEQKVADRTRELKALYEVSAVASQAFDLKQMLSESLCHTLEAVRSSSGAIYLLEEAYNELPGKFLRREAWQGIPDNLLAQSEQLQADEGIINWVIRYNEPVLLPEVRQNDTLPEYLLVQSPLSLLIVPLQASRQVYGILFLGRHPDKSFTLEEVALLTTLADQIGQAVESFILRKQTQQMAVMKERERLARDLHDSVTQSLYGLAELAEAGQIQLEMQNPGAAVHLFVRIGQAARQALREMRLFIYQLRPVELDEGLVSALHLRLAAVEGRSDVHTRLVVDESIRLPAEVEENLFQIAQEALNNILKHAHSENVAIHLDHTDHQIVMQIEDDGCGFLVEESDTGGMGLNNMRERAAAIGGKLDICSTPGKGTIVKVSVAEDWE